MRDIRRIFRRGIGFALVPAIGAIASFVALPVLTSRFGESGWASIAIGLSVGTASSVLVELGWSLDGPPRVSRAGPRSRQTWFALSLWTKIAMFPIVGLAASLVAAIIASDYVVESAMTALSGVALGFSSNWYFIGTGSPIRMVLSDSLPKLLSAGLAAILLSLGFPLIVYPILLLSGALSSPIISYRMVFGHEKPSRGVVSLFRLKLAILGQMTALRGRAASAVYLSLPTALLGLVFPAGVANFAAADRLQRMALTFMQILPNSMIGWATESTDVRLRWSRVSFSILANSVLGLLAAGCWILIMPILAKLIFSDVVDLPLPIIYMSAGLIWITVTSRAVGGIGLVAFRGTRHVSNSAIIGALVGILSILYLGFLWGAIGAFVGLLSAEAVVLMWQVGALLRIRPTRQT